MKKVLLGILLQLWIAGAVAQDIYKITYPYFSDDAMLKQDPVVVYVSKDTFVITKQSVADENSRVPYEESFINTSTPKFFKQSVCTEMQIPQGPKEGDSISFWNVSGALVFDQNQ